MPRHPPSCKSVHPAPESNDADVGRGHGVSLRPRPPILFRVSLDPAHAHSVLLAECVGPHIVHGGDPKVLRNHCSNYLAQQALRQWLLPACPHREREPRNDPCPSWAGRHEVELGGHREGRVPVPNANAVRGVEDARSLHVSVGLGVAPVLKGEPLHCDVPLFGRYWIADLLRDVCVLYCLQRRNLANPVRLEPRTRAKVHPHHAPRVPSSACTLAWESHSRPDTWARPPRAGTVREADQRSSLSCTASPRGSTAPRRASHLPALASLGALWQQTPRASPGRHLPTPKRAPVAPELETRRRSFVGWSFRCPGGCQVSWCTHLDRRTHIHGSGR
mmetsp:Transcript_35548/g.87417  ORF Transcript_35548/g.87417 Transcript_35548/m.87417 type:complete len:333 (+) Transcript_35548:572-1570(+)